MVNIADAPIQAGETFLTRHNNTATTSNTDFTFSSVQDSITVYNYGNYPIIATSGSETKRIGPNGDLHKFKEDSATVAIKTSELTCPVMIEGRSMALVQGTVDLQARTDVQSIGSQLAELSAAGRKIKIVAGVIRNDGTGWKFIDVSNGVANHEKLNLLSVTADSTQITVNFNFNAKNVLSFVAAPDETFAQKGYFCGASVGTSLVNIKLSQAPKTVGGYITYNGTSWAVNSANTGVSVTSFTAGKLLISHEDVGASSYLGAASCRGGKYNAELGSLGNVTTEIEFYDSARALVTTPTTDMKVFFTRSSPSAAVLNPLNIADGNGNIWCLGVFEIV
jgi:hypothetical protein